VCVCCFVYSNKTQQQTHTKTNLNNTHQYWGPWFPQIRAKEHVPTVADVPLRPVPGVAGSSPFTLTTSLATLIPSSCIYIYIYAYPTTNAVDKQGQSPGGSVPGLIQSSSSLISEGRMMVEFLRYWGLKGMWNLPPPMTRAKQAKWRLLLLLLVKK